MPDRHVIEEPYAAEPEPQDAEPVASKEIGPGGGAERQEPPERLSTSRIRGLLMETVQVKETRNQRRRRQNRQALLDAAESLMEEKGSDATTVQEIADRADVALGTFYSYFDSKDEIVVAVMEGAMTRMARRIRAVTVNFTDAGQVFAYGVRVVMEAAAFDPKWRWLLKRPDTLADAMARMFAPYGKIDIRQAVEAKRYDLDDVDLVWRQAIWAMVATCVAIASGQRPDVDPESLLEQATANILCMVGVSREDAREIVRRPRPRLPEE